MSDGVAFVDGKYVGRDEAKISVFDLGFSRSDVAYDVVSTWKGQFFRLDDHVERFITSCAGVRIDCPYDTETIKQILAECTYRAELQDAYVEVLVTRGQFTVPGSRDLRQTKPNFMAYAVPYVWIVSPEKQDIGVHLWISHTPRIPDAVIDARYKNFHWGDLTQAQLQALDAGADVAILCSLNGYLSEGPGFNVFFITDGKMYTPGANVLEGITRKTVFELATESGIPVAAGDYLPEQLRAADEVFISSTAGGIMPITQVDGRRLGNGKPGVVTRQLRQLYWSKREAGWHGTLITDLLATQKIA
jgi:branched-chain amino acid aminotransferase